MVNAPQPLFEGLARFRQLETQTSELRNELDAVKAYLAGFPGRCRAVEGYVAVRSFLQAHCDKENTFSAYRSQTELLLLWSLLVAEKPLLELTRSDAQSFVDFCKSPPTSWIGTIIKGRFLRIGGRKACDSDDYIVNSAWRPFDWHSPKRSLTASSDEKSAPVSGLSDANAGRLVSICRSFFFHAIWEEWTEVNPFTAKILPAQGNGSNTGPVSRSLSREQWAYVVENAENMASIDPRHERTLFALSTLFSLQLRASDLAGLQQNAPTMGDFRKDAKGCWWLHIHLSKGRLEKVRAPDDYIDTYLERYRRYLGLPPLPSVNENTPLLSTLKDRPGLSARHIRALLQTVFDRAIAGMQRDGWSDREIDNLRSASLQWLRNTSAKFDSSKISSTALRANLRVSDATRYCVDAPAHVHMDEQANIEDNRFPIRRN